MSKPSFSFKRQQQDYLVERWSPFLVAAGIPTRGRTAYEIFLIAGRIIADKSLFSRTVEKHLEQPGEYPALLPSGLRLEVLRELPPEEKAALRARIGA